MIDKELLDILACPDCKSDVKLENEKIVCQGCGKRYPINRETFGSRLNEVGLPKKRLSGMPIGEKRDDQEGLWKLVFSDSNRPNGRQLPDLHAERGCLGIDVDEEEECDEP